MNSPYMSAYLTVGSFTTWLRTYTLNVERDMPDYWNSSMPLPLPTSQLTLTFEAISHPLLLAWIDTPDLGLSGTVTTLTEGDEVQQVISFTDAYCLNAWQDVSPNDPESITQQTVVVSLNVTSCTVPPNFVHWPPISSN